MRDVIGRMRWGYAGRYWKDEVGICGTDHLPEIGPAGLPFLDQPPQSTKNGKQERQTICKPKKECLFCIQLVDCQ